MPDCFIKNLAPEKEMFEIDIDDWKITIKREEDGKVAIYICDLDDGVETKYILGQNDKA